MSEGATHPLAGVVAAVVVLAVVTGVWFGRPVSDRVARPEAVRHATIVTEAAGTRRITVHVAGAVARPGLVDLREGARVADAVAAAGGAEAGAMLESLNLAQTVTDGQQIVVRAEGRPLTIGPTDDGRIRLNAADANQLTALPGVGPVLAESIVSYRDEHGPFSTVEDLLSVPGIGEAKLADIRDRVNVP